MNFCSHCGAPLSQRIPADDDRLRYVCDACGTIHYQNPKMVVGCIPEWKDRILLCRRAIEPRKGYWTLPAGYLENGETVEDGIRRETYEEARARLETLEPFAMISLSFISQIYIMARGRLKAPEFAAGEESLAVDLFAEDRIPWPQMAFPVIRETLVRYFQDRARGVFTFHVLNLQPEGKMER